jgi:peptidoglycan hydrolase FlgJ
MEVHTLNRNVQAADLPMERLAASSQVSQQEKLTEVSRQFEAVLLRQILGQAQKPMFQSSLFNSSSSNAIYQDMITEQLADRISRGGSFGFAKVLQQQLTSPSTENIKSETTAAARESTETAVSRSGGSKIQAQPGKRI